MTEADVPGAALMIRPLAAADRMRWEPLWQGYQDFYEVDLPSATTEATFSRFLDPSAPMFCLVAEEGGAILGIVHYVFHSSTWTLGEYCYLQDLFTSAQARGRGLGRALIAAVVDRAKIKGASRVYWLTHETNSQAMLLYDQVAQKPGFVQYRIVF